MKYLKYKNVMILCCGFPILLLIADGISYLVVKSSTNLNQIPQLLILIIFLVIELPLFIAYFQFVELKDNKLVNYHWNIKAFEIEFSNIKQWGHFNSIGGITYYPFIYISDRTFVKSKFDFIKIKSRKYKYIRIFPYDDRLEYWLKQNATDKFL
ncbi:MAG: hypothetical protein E7L17_07085 [Clostridium sp.]|uniref:hypothetical protein n=1 Tax=Clostridium sp. TaxID=1506 RepID=UPI00290861B4|nr:hypothetical protein [Clostridium sp.]MDU7337860.1 hypothetical protein [Clostridium sp.]